MGNIRPSFIKIRAIHLVEDHGEKFTDDFEHNKQMVQWDCGVCYPLPTAPS
jgi:ribosomal protein S17E